MSAALLGPCPPCPECSHRHRFGRCAHCECSLWDGPGAAARYNEAMTARAHSTALAVVEVDAERPEVECSHEWVEETRHAMPNDELEFLYFCTKCLERTHKYVTRARYLSDPKMRELSKKSLDAKRYSQKVVVVSSDNSAMVIDGYQEQAPPPVWPAVEQHLVAPHKRSVSCECKLCVEWGKLVDENLNAYRLDAVVDSEGQ